MENKKTGLMVLLMFFALAACSQKETTNDKNQTKTMETYSKKELKQKLSPLEYHVTQENGTERPFTGKFWDHFKKGTYSCIVCDAELFESDTKFESGCGWPSFSDVKEKENFKFEKDLSHGMNRTEVRCANCDSHLGHVFNDGPKPTGLRYCINSASIKFKE